jgi:UDP-N-acetylmuramate dehydrogenase
MPIETISASTLSALRIGGTVRHTSVSSDEELLAALSYAKENNLRVHIHGEGTNTYFGTDLLNLLVITIAYKGYEVKEEKDTITVVVAGGENWDEFVAFTVHSSWWGIENLSGIPGTVGAAPVQNIGAYGAELADVLFSVRAYDMEEKRFVTHCNSACHFGYRDSIFKRLKGRYVITHITLSLSKLPHPKLSYKPLDTLKEKKDITPYDIREVVLATRKAKLPDYKAHPNCGSFFKNPIVDGNRFTRIKEDFPNLMYFKDEAGYKIPAGWLIEHVAEMKGAKSGNVGTWRDQALVLVNYGDATGEECASFANSIIERIKEKTGITLEQEVQFVS